jgi:hypothetical protein
LVVRLRTIIARLADTMGQADPSIEPSITRVENDLAELVDRVHQRVLRQAVRDARHGR